MGQKILITTEGLKISAELNDTKTSSAIEEALPIKSKVSRWGGEIYFTIPVKAGPEEGCREVVEAGELGYWPTGSAFCIFFGTTPASKADEIRAASAVNIVGNLTEKDLSNLWNVPDGKDISIEKA